jgi:hypothetical protein
VHPVIRDCPKNATIILVLNAEESGKVDFAWQMMMQKMNVSEGMNQRTSRIEIILCSLRTVGDTISFSN